MKKVLFALSFSLITESLWAANMGPFNWDESGASITAPVSIPVLSSTTISTLNNYKNQIVICNTCANSVGTYAICIATQTAIGNNGPNFVIIGSTTGAQPACK